MFYSITNNASLVLLYKIHFSNQLYTWLSPTVPSVVSTLDSVIAKQTQVD